MGLVLGPLAFAISDDDQIAVTRFAGFKNGQGATIGILTRENGAWKPSRIRAVGDGAISNLRAAPGVAQCLGGVLDNLFAQEQLLAFNKYVETGYISLAEAKHHLQNSINILDRPVTFYHVLTPEPPPRGLQALGVPEEVTFKMLTSGPGMKETGGYVSASLYSVAGQSLELAPMADVPSVVYHELPWMKDPDFAPATKHLFSREKYPFIWELGRAATTDVHEFPHLMAIAGQDIASEMLHVGVPNHEQLKGAYVSAQFLSQENTDKFAKMFGEYLFLRSETNPGKTVFIVPLEKYLEKFPPRRYDHSHKAVFEAKLGKSTEETFQLFETLKYLQHQNLDIKYKGKNLSTPIVFSSTAAGELMVPLDLLLTSHFKMDSKVFKDFKGPKTQISMRGASLDIPWPEKLLDPAASHRLEGVWDGVPLQIANLDPKLVATDPQYVPAVFSGIFDHYMRQFAGDKGIEAELIQQIASKLKLSGVHFVVTTQYPKTAEVLRSMRPQREKVVDLSTDAHSTVVWEQLEKDSDGKLKRPSKNLYSFSFDQLATARGWTYMANGRDYKKMPFVRPGYHWWLQGVSEP
jgi:hypothetical protein